jgi:hypothetical protein
MAANEASGRIVLQDLHMRLADPNARGMHAQLHVHAVLATTCANVHDSSCGGEEAGGDGVFRVMFEIPSSAYVDRFELAHALSGQPHISILLAEDTDVEAMALGTAVDTGLQIDEPRPQLVTLQVTLQGTLPEQQAEGLAGSRQPVLRVLDLTIPVHVRYHAAAPATDTAVFREALLQLPALQYCPAGGEGEGAEACLPLALSPHLQAAAAAAPVILRFPIASLAHYSAIRVLTELVVTLTMLAVMAAIARVGKTKGKGK